MIKEDMKTTDGKIARFDARLPFSQKQLFEEAAQAGGYRNLTDFVFKAAEQRAKEILKERDRILASERDREVFFNALLNPPEPNDELLSTKEAFLNM